VKTNVIIRVPILIKTMKSVELIASPSEFWDRIETMVAKYNLVIFEGRTAKVNLAKIKRLEDLRKNCKVEFGWNLCIAQVEPSSESNASSAEQGWIIVRPPKLDEEQRTISECSIGGQEKWVTEDGILIKNAELQSLFRRCRTIFHSKDANQKVTYIWDQSGRRTSDVRRFTEGALLLQSEGWTFRNDVGTYTILLPTRDSLSR